MKSLFKTIAPLAALAAASLVPAQDVRVGGARTFGLGGAGVALPLDVWETHRLNPALLGFADKRLRYGIPYSGLHARRLALSDFSKAADDARSDSDLGRYARDFGNDTKDLGLSYGEGFSLGGFALSLEGQAGARTIPNAALRDWARSDADPDALPDNARLDAYGLAYYDVAGSYGTEVLRGRERVAVGATARYISTYYAHRFVDADAIKNDGDAQPGPEMDGRDALRKSGLGIDLGVLASSEQAKNLTLGANVHNLVEPRIRFDRRDPNGAESSLRPFQRRIDVGAAYLVKGHYLGALDLIDLGNHAGMAGVRVGAEYTVSRFFSVRAGFDSRASAVVGVSLFGVNLGIGGNGVASIATSLRF